MWLIDSLFSTTASPEVQPAVDTEEQILVGVVRQSLPRTDSFFNSVLPFGWLLDPPKPRHAVIATSIFPQLHSEQPSEGQAFEQQTSHQQAEAQTEPTAERSQDDPALQEEKPPEAGSTLIPQECTTEEQIDQMGADCTTAEAAAQQAGQAATASEALGPAAPPAISIAAPCLPAAASQPQALLVAPLPSLTCADPAASDAGIAQAELEAVGSPSTPCKDSETQDAAPMTPVLPELADSPRAAPKPTAKPEPDLGFPSSSAAESAPACEPDTDAEGLVHALEVAPAAGREAGPIAAAQDAAAQPEAGASPLEKALEAKRLQNTASARQEAFKAAESELDQLHKATAAAEAGQQAVQVSGLPVGQSAIEAVGERDQEHVGPETSASEAAGQGSLSGPEDMGEAQRDLITRQNRQQTAEQKSIAAIQPAAVHSPASHHTADYTPEAPHSPPPLPPGLPPGLPGAVSDASDVSSGLSEAETPPSSRTDKGDTQDASAVVAVGNKAALFWSSPASFIVRNFAVGEVLGEGASAIVRRAERIITGMVYAIKCVDHSKVRGDAWARETALHSPLDHPNVLRLHSYWRERGYTCLILEHTSKGSLKEHLQKHGPLPEPEAARIILEVAQGLQYCHKQDVVHRDNKPGNILFGEGGEAKLADFGISAKTRGCSLFCFGTPDYVSPEILATEPHGKPVDAWSLGVMLYEMLLGLRPFAARNGGERQWRILHADFAFPGECRVSHGARDLMRRLLVRDPKKRLSIEGVLQHPWIRTPSTPATALPTPPSAASAAAARAGRHRVMFFSSST
ncbi:hypothetical protein WJX73_000357 [Symbiochloris irregularis]|uniref:Protein kinase domain-containing protein n=1 Tax=Symbiochloris irregularis TaxID=706552 RepID=A0AAW1NNN5_9CHLO